jgi:hypothetical protein
MEKLDLTPWLREGLRAGFLQRPRIERSPTPMELFSLGLFSVVIELVLGRYEIDGPALFNLRGWLAPWWAVTATMLLVWALLWRKDATDGTPQPSLARWMALWVVASIPPGVVSQLLAAANAHESLPPQLAQSPLFAWGVYFLLWVWTVLIAVRLGANFGMGRRRLAVLGLGFLAIFGVTAWEVPDRPWEAPAAEVAETPKLALSQETFEAQQDVFRKAVEQLAPQRPDVTDVYGLVFAPYASEDVFLRESTLVANVLAQRFDAQGRVLQLVNHVDTAERLPWATPVNLKRAIDALAERMDREHDLLVIYMTSHGARDFQLAAAHPPLDVDAVSPGDLRKALDEAGIRHRVIAISACFSGGWVGPLASDTSLVMTAADADHTSYGCGRLSELTFFGRAMFDEQLRKTHSFEQAFAAAVPLIKQREIDARKPDGFSNPQISVGEGIRPLLKALEQRLDGAARP